MKEDDKQQARLRDLVQEAAPDAKFTAYRLTPKLVESKIVGETYTLLPSGKVMVCELTMANGFTVRGEASVIDKANFIEQIGKDISRRRAVDNAFMVEGYLMQERMYQEHQTET